MASDVQRLSRRNFVRAALLGGAVSGTSAGTASAQQGTQHTIDMTDQLVFDPDDITIAPGDTIVWENVGQVGHSVTAYEDAIPPEAEYFASGGFEDEATARSSYAVGDPESGDIVEDATYQHTFEVEGTYEYFCIPHESVGMVGAVEVVAGGGADESGSTVPSVPDAAKTLLIAVSGALVAVVSFAYIFLKYGGDYELSESDSGK